MHELRFIALAMARRRDNPQPRMASSSADEVTSDSGLLQEWVARLRKRMECDTREMRNADRALPNLKRG
jgi:hypothetical protein